MPQLHWNMTTIHIDFVFCSTFIYLALWTGEPLSNLFHSDRQALCQYHYLLLCCSLTIYTASCMTAQQMLVLNRNHFIEWDAFYGWFLEVGFRLQPIWVLHVVIYNWNANNENYLCVSSSSVSECTQFQRRYFHQFPQLSLFRQPVIDCALIAVGPLEPP